MSRFSSTRKHRNDSAFNRAFEHTRQLVLNEWRYFLASFSREKVVSSLKTLAWVAPMTLLIWIYAERETLLRKDNQTAPIELIGDANRIVTLVRPADKNLILKLEGPSGKLQTVLQDLQGSGETSAQRLKIEIPSAYGVDLEHQIPSLGLIQDQKIFRDAGVTVLDVQPAILVVKIDSVAEVKVPVQAPPDVKNVEGAPTFTPSEVVIKGPKNFLDAHKRELVAYADLAPVAGRSPDKYQLTDVPLDLPQALRNEQVTMTPAKVNATVSIRAADALHEFKGIPIFVAVPPPGDLLRKYKVVYRASLPSLEITGPKEVVDAMSRDDYAPRPYATLKVLPDDVGKGKIKRAVSFELGNNQVHATDRYDNKVEFELNEIPASERSGAD